MNTNQYIAHEMRAGLLVAKDTGFGLLEAVFDIRLSNYIRQLSQDRLNEQSKNGKSGWWNENLCSLSYLKKQLEKDVKQGNWVDIINLSGMIYVRELIDTDRANIGIESSINNNIEKIIKDIIKREGGFVNDPVDRGGATKYGITQETLTFYLGRDATLDDVKNLAKQTAFEIYYQKYYQRPKIDQLPVNLQEIILDMAVNHGDKNAIFMLQAVLVNRGFVIDTDGKIGPVTLGIVSDAIEQTGIQELINEIVDIRVGFYEAIVKRDETQRKFLAGWVARAEGFREVAYA